MMEKKKGMHIPKYFRSRCNIKPIDKEFKEFEIIDEDNNN